MKKVSVIGWSQPGASTSMLGTAAENGPSEIAMSQSTFSDAPSTVTVTSRRTSPVVGPTVGEEGVDAPMVTGRAVMTTVPSSRQVGALVAVTTQVRGPSSARPLTATFGGSSWNMDAHRATMPLVAIDCARRRGRSVNAVVFEEVPASVTELPSQVALVASISSSHCAAASPAVTAVPGVAAVRPTAPAVPGVEVVDVALMSCEQPAIWTAATAAASAVARRRRCGRRSRRSVRPHACPLSRTGGPSGVGS
jgi:hypothetical protein